MAVVEKIKEDYSIEVSSGEYIGNNLFDILDGIISESDGV